jgi:Tol biopolymer transport system component
VETISIASTDRHVEYVATGRVEDPIWSCDGSYIEFKENGALHRFTPAVSAAPTSATAPLNPCNHDSGISPDGQWQAFLAADKGVAPESTKKDVELQLMSLKDKKVRVLAKILGGQDMANLPSWSPDSQRLAFVSYERLPEESMSAK